MDSYIQKYLKYKQKYLLLKGGAKRTLFYILSYNNYNYTINLYKFPIWTMNTPFQFENNEIEIKKKGLFEHIYDFYINKVKKVYYDDDQYIIYCKNSDKDINIKISLLLKEKTFNIDIEKNDLKINLEGKFTFDEKEFKNFKFKIIQSKLIISNINITYPFIIEDKEFTLKELFNEKLEIKQINDKKKLDELLLDFYTITIDNTYYTLLNEIKQNFSFNKVMLLDCKKILVYHKDKNNFLYYDPSTLSLTTIDDGKKLCIKKNNNIISYLNDINYTIYVDETSKITKIKYKNCTINGAFTYENDYIKINSLVNLTINKIIITLSDFKCCILTDIIKAKYSINEIYSSDPFLHNILLYLNKEDPKINNLKDVTIDQITSTIYDYENEYDIFRDNNMNTFCMGQNILFKSIYNSLFNLFYIENRDEINKLRNTNILITTHYIRKKLLIKFESIKCDLHKICNTQEDNNFLLQNIPKKIITTNKDFEIFSNKASSFIDFPPTMKLIFDTGNASITIIGIKLVEELGLIPKDTFVTQGSGIGGEIDYEGKYVNVKLKFKLNTSYNIKDKEYEFNAIIDNHNLTDTLLLGQSSKGLKKFFEDNYCIVYNHTKQDYDSYYNNLLKSIMSDIQMVQQINKFTPIPDMLDFISNINRKSDNYTVTFLDNDLLKTLFDELKNDKFKIIIPFLEASLDYSDINVNISYINYILVNYKLLKTIFTKEDLKSLIQKIKDSISKLETDKSNDDLIDEIKKLK